MSILLTIEQVAELLDCSRITYDRPACIWIKRTWRHCEPPKQTSQMYRCSPLT